jgi:two-component system, NarL family, sensor histidine kinase UhpB
LTTLTTFNPVYDRHHKRIAVTCASTDITDVKRVEVELRSSQDQLRALAGRMESVREEERKAVSRDMHDDLGQALTALRMDLAWIRNRVQTDFPSYQRALLDKIGEMGRLIDKTSDTVRDLCARLRPGILDDLGLTAAIGWQASDFSKRTGIRCIVRMPLQEPKLDSDLSASVFRIFQEVLTNIARHAKASCVQVSLRAHKGELSLEALDNGRGISEKEVHASRSLGLLGMRERAHALGGVIVIAPRMRRGTKVSLRVPLS